MNNLATTTILFCSIIFLLATTCNEYSEKKKHKNIQDTTNTEVVVNFAKELGKLRRPELYNNNSLLRTPSTAITDKYKKEIGITKIMRSWVTIDDYWDYKTDSYNFNFKVGWDLNLWDNFYDYMERFSDISEEIILNVRGYHGEVVQNKITMAQWREATKRGIKHYKRRYPKIKYIEALNEYAHSGFGGLTNDQYYEFYKVFYEIVNEINGELNPEIPLQVGGPCITGGSIVDGSKREKMRAFIKNYTRDSNPNKKLHFLSYHAYSVVDDDPSAVANEEELIDGWLEEAGLPMALPIFVNEMGGFAGQKEFNKIGKDQVIQAAGMNSLFYFYNQQPDLQAFHWVIQHKSNDRKTQIYDNLRWTPYGISLKMQSRMADTQVEARIPELSNGKGVYALASKEKDRLTIQVWNYQWVDGKETHSVKINFKNLPNQFKGESFRVNEYVLDSNHNNVHSSYSIFTKTAEEDQLTLTKDSTLDYKDNINYRVELEPNAIVLIEVLSR